jgi:hypothetical protein
MQKYNEKFVVRQPVTFQDKTRFNVHRLLRAVDKNTLLSKLANQDDSQGLPIHVINIPSG